MLIDTHCHIHEILGHDETMPVAQKWHDGGITDPATVIHDAHTAGVSGMICIGTTLADSAIAVDYVANTDAAYATIGIHPHEAKDHIHNPGKLAEFAALATHSKVVGVGECGLDYFYTHSNREDQIAMLRYQIELALAHNLPLSFHVREAFDDFWPVFDSYEGIRGVLHSYTDSISNLHKAVERGLYFGVNGIATFAKNPDQIAMYKAIPADRLLLETDAPFLTPTPHRGKICEPKHVRVTAEFLANLRNVTFSEIAETSSANARQLFGME